MSIGKKMSKDDYRRKCATTSDIPVFFTDWFWDAIVGPNGWDVLYYTADVALWAVFPYQIQHTPWGRLLPTPPLTQYAGPYIHTTPEMRQSKKYSYAEQVLTTLFDAIETELADAYGQRWGPWADYWLPMYWRHYTQYSRITYQLPCNTDYVNIAKGYSTQVRNKLKNPHHVRLRQDTGTDTLYLCMQMTMTKQHKQMKFSEKQLGNLYQALSLHGQGVLLSAFSQDEALTSALFLWDQQTLYYYLAGSRTDHTEYNASTLLIDAGIKMACEKRLTFDFAGSMLHGLSDFYQSFGARPICYQAFANNYSAQFDCSFENAARRMIFSL